MSKHVSHCISNVESNLSLGMHRLQVRSQKFISGVIQAPIVYVHVRVCMCMCICVPENFKKNFFYTWSSKAINLANISGFINKMFSLSLALKNFGRDLNPPPSGYACDRLTLDTQFSFS